MADISAERLDECVLLYLEFSIQEQSPAREGIGLVKTPGKGAGKRKTALASFKAGNFAAGKS